MKFFCYKLKRGENLTRQAKEKLINGIDTLAWLLLIVFTAANSWKAALVFVGAFATAWMLEWYLARDDDDGN